MLYFLFALVCIASSEVYQNDGYGIDKEPVPDNSYGSTYEKPIPVNGDYGVPVYKPEEKNECRKIKHLSIHRQRTAEAEFSQLKGYKDHRFITISCPNTQKPYALVTAKEGADTIFNFASEVRMEDVIVLATGFNLDYTAECRHNRIHGKTFNDRDVSIKKIACVQLPEPNPITAL